MFRKSPGCCAAEFRRARSGANSRNRERGMSSLVTWRPHRTGWLRSYGVDAS